MTAPRSMHIDTNGGSRDTELRLLTVMPDGVRSGDITVTTVTPVAKRPISCRYNAGLIAGFTAPSW